MSRTPTGFVSENQLRVLVWLAKYGPATRRQIDDGTGLNVNQSTTILNTLMAHGQVVRTAVGETWERFVYRLEPQLEAMVRGGGQLGSGSGELPLLEARASS